MAHYQNQYDANPIRQTDEYGHPIDTTGTANYGNQVPYGTAAAAATGHHGHHHKKEHGGLTGKLHRSGSSSSSSSSSSEDDGHGGRRKKKGLKDKLKEKLPGGGHKEEDHTPAYGSTTAPGAYGSTTTPGGYGAAVQPQEKKGIMDKIKEKLPGGHHH